MKDEIVAILEPLRSQIDELETLESDIDYIDDMADTFAETAADFRTWAADQGDDEDPTQLSRRMPARRIA